MQKPVELFVSAVAFVFGALAWLQLPAVCGFMLSSTLVGEKNWIYSVWLGVLIALVGIFSGAGALLRRSRHPLLLAGMAMCVGFLVACAVGTGWYDATCRAVYEAFPPPTGSV